MSDAANLFSALRQSADPAVVDSMEELVRDGSDRALNRINVLDFAAKKQLDEDRVFSACRPNRDLRAVLERPVPGLPRRPRHERGPEGHQQGRISLRLV